MLEQLERDLNDFDPQLRRAAVLALAGSAVDGDASAPPVANMHAHTFFSFNAYGYSPSAIAWLAKKQDIRLMGIVDFDVLDGVDEFLNACDSLGVRGSAGMETRIFLPEFVAREINSPGEPGVAYHMGIGFTTGQVPPEAAALLADLRQRAERRNRLVMARLNDYLAPLRVDYDADVLPLTPAGNPTERHIVQAYLQTAARTRPDRIVFWADKLSMPPDEVASNLADAPRFQNLVRVRLMKRGGHGYIAPTADTFPSLAQFHRLILACGALPCAAWLDGTSQGEQDITELLGLLIGQDVAVLNIIPERNWNIADPDERHQKVEKLYEIVHLARDLDLPLNVGTEMNSFGQRLVDDFSAAELAPVRRAFLDGAHFIYGHTVLQRALGLGYSSAWAQSQFPGRRERNLFYTQVGYRIPPGRASLDKLRTIGGSPDPEEFSSRLAGLFPLENNSDGEG
jgi:hypothetical protein